MADLRLSPLPGTPSSRAGSSGSGSSDSSWSVAGNTLELVTILGVPRCGSDLVAAGDLRALSKLVDADLTAPGVELLCQFQWYRGEPGSNVWEPIYSATRPHYTPGPEDVGLALKAVVAPRVPAGSPLDALNRCAPHCRCKESKRPALGETVLVVAALGVWTCRSVSTSDTSWRSRSPPRMPPRLLLRPPQPTPHRNHAAGGREPQRGAALRRARWGRGAVHCQPPNRCQAARSG